MAFSSPLLSFYQKKFGHTEKLKREAEKVKCYNLCFTFPKYRIIQFNLFFRAFACIKEKITRKQLQDKNRIMIYGSIKTFESQLLYKDFQNTQWEFIPFKMLLSLTFFYVLWSRSFVKQNGLLSFIISPNPWYKVKISFSCAATQFIYLISNGQCLYSLNHIYTSPLNFLQLLHNLPFCAAVFLT